MIVGTGVDIVKVERIRTSVARWGEKFAAKILTDNELRKFSSYKDGGAAYLSRQFAAKEAVSKALGTGMGAGISFSQIAIGRIESGAPIVDLAGPALERSNKLSITSWHISISDEKEYTIAFAVAEAAGKNNAN
ncbi:MAG: holo-ACP synthase [Pseudomonadales bacterium]